LYFARLQVLDDVGGFIFTHYHHYNGGFLGVTEHAKLFFVRHINIGFFFIFCHCLNPISG